MPGVTRREMLVALPALAAALAAEEALAGGRWVLLGERRVTDRLDHDVIAVTGARGDFEAVQVRVRGHAVQFRDMKVHYANGATQDVALRAVVPAGGESRVIDLVGRERVIRRIEFWYDAQTPRRGRGAQVRVFGRR
ncbi:MAG TPA: hypothetical protein VLI67_02815 [Vicinamibacteria bacterium]|nr:hypothetical protein [Vicinamibacteria bacterium]